MKYLYLLLVLFLAAHIELGDSTQIIAPIFIPIILAAASLASTAYQVYSAEDQKKTARELRDQDLPEYAQPASARAVLQTARMNASMRGFPGQDIAEASMRESSADAYSRVKEFATSPSQAVASVGKIHSKELAQEREFAKMGAGYQAGASRDLMAANQWMTAQKQYEWEKSTYDPYMQDMAAAAALEGGAQQNYFGALSSISSMTMMGLGKTRAFNDLFRGGGGFEGSDGGNRGGYNTVPQRRL